MQSDVPNCALPVDLTCLKARQVPMKAEVIV
jgi:hypothetical protein